MVTERQITIVTRTDGDGVQVYVRSDGYGTEGSFIPTGIKAQDHATATRLVAAKLAGTA